jgi:hypothetical protein
MGIQVYDPGGRRTTRRSPFQPQAPAPKIRTIQDEGTRPSGSVYESVARRIAGVNPVAAKPKDEKGLGEKFFGTAVGSGLGKVINNPVVKSILQPLDVFGIPQRAIASTINEVADVFAGEGFSPKDWIDQVNPDAWLDGNMEGSIGMGDVWQKHGKALGAGKNQWVDAAVGLTGDIVTDPFTYFFGAGVVDKGLDALRTGSRLGAGIAAKGATKLDDFAALEAAVAKADDITGGASKLRKDWEFYDPDKIASGASGGASDVSDVVGANKAAKKGSRRSLTGRSTRFDMIEEARDLIGRADEGVLNQLYGGPDVVREALEEIQFKSGRGLSASSGKISPQAQELVETALNIKPPAVRARVPFTRQQGVAVPGTEAFAQGLGNRMGGVRQRFNDSDLGTAMVAAKAPVDLEPAAMVMARGAGATAEEFKTASTAYGVAQGRRAVTGEYSVAAQNAIQGSRKKIMEEIKQRPGKNMREKNAAYMADVENPAIPTQLNVLFEALGGEMATRHGITIPKLDRGGSGGLDYATHSWAPEFRRFMATSKNKKIADMWNDRLGNITKLDLTEESGRLKARQILPGDKLPMPDGTEYTVITGSIDEINSAAKLHGFKGRVLEDSPMKMVDDYAQAVAEDVGRRASRADAIAKGNPYLEYSKGLLDDPAVDLSPAQEAIRRQQFDEAVAEQMAAQERIGQTPNIGEATRSVKARQQAARDFDDAAESLTDSGNDRIARSMEADKNGKFYDMVQGAYDEWRLIGSNKAVAVDPEFDRMFQNFAKVISDPGPVGKVYRELNKYFKNFAVLSPGFHVRNGLSAIYMNIADGVAMRTTGKGISVWRDFSKISKDGENVLAGVKFLDDLRAGRKMEYGTAAEQAQIADAFRSVFGSGAGGRFTESGIVDGGFNRLSRRITDNRVTRKSQDAGAFVEGAVRMGVAIDTIQNGGSVAQAVSRITRLHFDYSETSTFDDKAKQAMPFWSFFSRNIPLQTMQVWSRPGAYLAYEKIKNNFGQPEVFEGRQGEIPGYIEDGGGMPINLGPFGNWLEPDLPHTRVTEDIERYANILENPLGATTGLSPVLTAPLEYGFKKDAFTGQNFGPTDWEHVSNPLEFIQMLPLLPTSQVKYKDGNFFIKTEALNALQAIDPTLSRVNRMSGSGGREKERTIESWLRYFGLPVRNITEKQMTNAAKSRSFDDADMRAMERSLQP